MFIEESKLEKLLTKAYEEGWYGSKDCAAEAVGKIVLDYKNESKGQEPKKQAKKKAVKKKASATQRLSNSVVGYVPSHHDWAEMSARPENVAIRDGQPGSMTFTGGYTSRASTMARHLSLAGGIRNPSISDHRAALEREMAAAMRMPSPIPPPSSGEESLYQGQRASSEMMEDVQAWIAPPSDPSLYPLRSPSDNPCNEIDMQGDPVVLHELPTDPILALQAAQNPIIRHEGWSDHQSFAWSDGSVHNMPESQGDG